MQLTATIDVEGTSLTGDLSITASGTTIVHLDKVTSVGGSITTSDLAELHLGKLSSTNTMTSGAKVMDLSSLASQGAKNSGGAAAVRGATISLNKITNFNAPKLDVTGVVSVVAATDITIHDFSVGGTGAFGTTVYSLAAKNLTVNGLAATNSMTFTKSASVFPKLVDLNVTGDAATSSPYITTQTNAVSVTSDVLTTLTTGGTIDMVSLHGAAKLTALTTSGYSRDFNCGAS